MSADEASGMSLPLPNGDDEFLQAIRNESQTVLARHLQPGDSVALVDLPNQRNVGDSLIWAGEMAYVKRLDLQIQYGSDLTTHVAGALERRLPAGSGTILLHGGGNFGDLWEGHQIFRERLVDEFPEHKIVQLPQSIFFRSAARARAANDALARHRDFTILVRDLNSMERAREQLPDLTVEFCPDMALGWRAEPRQRNLLDGDKVVVLARSDKEASGGLAEVGVDWISGRECLVTDWVLDRSDMARWEHARRRTRRAAVMARARRRAFSGTGLGRQQQTFWYNIEAINWLNIQGGVKLFSGAEAIAVDRLHAHVLAGLMGVKHVLLDNNYGKLGAVFRDYSHRFSTARKAATVDEAREVVLELTSGA